MLEEHGWLSSERSTVGSKSKIECSNDIETTSSKIIKVVVGWLDEATLDIYKYTRSDSVVANVI